MQVTYCDDYKKVQIKALKIFFKKSQNEPILKMFIRSLKPAMKSW